MTPEEHQSIIATINACSYFIIGMLCNDPIITLACFIAYILTVYPNAKNRIYGYFDYLFVKIGIKPPIKTENE